MENINSNLCINSNLEMDTSLEYVQGVYQKNSNNGLYTGIYSIDSGTVQNYFQFYSKLLNQQNMLQDYVRTSAYFSAIQSNP